MKHLTETQLNEYLDNALTTPAQVRLDVHLSDCMECRARLDFLQTIFQALAALPEQTPSCDLTPSVLQALPHDSSGLGWRLVVAIEAGLSLGILIIIIPFMTDRIVDFFSGLTGRFTMPNVKFPAPFDFHISLPVIILPHPSFPALPVMITHANFSIWLILGIVAFLLFAVGNFSLIFHNSSEA